ncbi:DUF6263 family protein [Bergeyella zoohelcum]|uniref:Lipoprotein n=1 Tax=Bergeyella zoohelcum ATCC 43767 TaxID=883096 RepID=K1LJH4_9FLAO|nr:DUF6263 family protein [Bergeyella zoohelcum]EKB56900.1 hypothetical protein HMPREF9699_01183 [Bergeyella zoohelcum ATCC 43767]SUV48636.1 Uncharacterised protein [Bergeyella zoohelcum]
MRKITATLAIAIVLFSCNKKETKTIEQVDPKTGKVTQIEVPVQDSVEIAKKEAEKFAIRDSAGVYHQYLRLEVGKEYPFTTQQKDVATVKMPDGTSQTVTRENTDVINFKVNAVQGGVYDMDIIFVSKKTTQTGMGVTQTVDTKAPAPKDEGLKNRWEIEKALTGNTLKMKLKENGEIISITGFDAVYNKLNTTVAKLTKDKKQQEAVLKEMKASFTEKIIRDQFSKNIFILPKKGAKIGETWSHSENVSPDGKVKLTSNYTLKKVENGIAEITVSGGVPKQTQKDTQQGVTQTLTSELSQNGSYQFDTKTGWIKSQNITVKNKESQSFTDGKRTETMTNSSVMTVIVNPSK